MARTPDSYFIPTATDTPKEVGDKAYRCGEELHPNDRRARWVDAQPSDVIDAYHAGQARQYECEGW